MQYLLPDTTVREAGAGPAIDIGEARGETLLLTLVITRILEKESIDITIWGSADGRDWGTIPIASYPQKFYCGTYRMRLDLSTRADVRYLQAKWDTGRWGAAKRKPLFTISLFIHSADRKFAYAGA
jgi:hypothetical protein